MGLFLDWPPLHSPHSWRAVIDANASFIRCGVASLDILFMSRKGTVGAWAVPRFELVTFLKHCGIFGQVLPILVVEVAQVGASQKRGMRNRLVTLLYFTDLMTRKEKAGVQ